MTAKPTKIELSSDGIHWQDITNQVVAFNQDEAIRDIADASEICRKAVEAIREVAFAMAYVSTEMVATASFSNAYWRASEDLRKRPKIKNRGIRPRGEVKITVELDPDHMLP